MLHAEAKFGSLLPVQWTVLYFIMPMKYGEAGYSICCNSFIMVSRKDIVSVIASISRGSYIHTPEKTGFGLITHIMYI